LPPGDALHEVLQFRLPDDGEVNERETRRRTGPEITGPVCSGPSSHQATSLAVQTMTENSWELVVFHNHSAGSLIPVAETRVLLATPKDPPLCPVSRTALCSF